MTQSPLPFEPEHPDERGLLATSEDIRACFRLILGREPSAEEWPGHSSHAGTPLEAVVHGYLTSLEFQRRNLLADSSEGTEITIQDRRLLVYPDDLGPAR